MSRVLKVDQEAAHNLRVCQHEIRDIAQSLIRVGHGIDADGIVNRLYMMQATLLALAAALDPQQVLPDETVEGDEVPWN